MTEPRLCRARATNVNALDLTHPQNKQVAEADLILGRLIGSSFLASGPNPQLGPI